MITTSGNGMFVLVKECIKETKYFFTTTPQLIVHYLTTKEHFYEVEEKFESTNTQNLLNSMLKSI